MGLETSSSPPALGGGLAGAHRLSGPPGGQGDTERLALTWLRGQCHSPRSRGPGGTEPAACGLLQPEVSRHPGPTAGCRPEGQRLGPQASRSVQAPRQGDPSRALLGPAGRRPGLPVFRGILVLPPLLMSVVGAWTRLGPLSSPRPLLPAPSPQLKPCRGCVYTFPPTSPSRLGT